MITVSVVVGNPKPMSRTRLIAQETVHAFLSSGGYTEQVFDLADYASELFEWPSGRVAAVSEQVAASDLVVFASPTYKATYTGLLKAFLDRYPAGGLAGVVAIPVMTGADLTHAVAPDAHLRPLLVELGASVPTSSLYFVTSQMDKMSESIADWAEFNTMLFRGLARVGAAVESSRSDAADADSRQTLEEIPDDQRGSDDQRGPDAIAATENTRRQI